MYEMLKRHEGLRLKPYLCTAGKLTIGYGLNLDAGISKEEAEYLLSSRVLKIEERLSKVLLFWDKISRVRKDVLVDMAYNLGIEGLLRFRTTLAMVGKEDYKGASEQMLNSLWARQVPIRAKELSDIMRDNKVSIY